MGFILRQKCYGQVSDHARKWFLPAFISFLFWLPAYSAAPAWLSQIKLSAINGYPDQPLAVINSKTVSPGEACTLKLSKNQTVQIQCLEIREQSALVQIEGMADPCVLTFTGIILPGETKPATVPPPAPQVQPAAPVQITPAQLFVSTGRVVDSTFSHRIPSPGWTWFFASIGLALVFGLAIGVGGAHWQYRKNLGEAMLADVIDRHFSRPHLLLNNVTLQTAEGTTQIDHVLVTNTGIFVIEAKHYQGWIFGDPSQSHWTQTIYRHKSRFPNPLRQNYGHIKALQSLFDLPEDHFHSVVVFTGNAEFKSDLGPNVVKLAGLIPFLNAERPVVFDERKMTYIVGRIEMKRNRRSVETDEYHINHVRTRIAGKTTGSRTMAVFSDAPANPFKPADGDEKYQPKA